MQEADHHHAVFDRPSVLTELCLRASYWFAGHRRGPQEVLREHQLNKGHKPWLNVVCLLSVCRGWTGKGLWLYAGREVGCLTPFQGVRHHCWTRWKRGDACAGSAPGVPGHPRSTGRWWGGTAGRRGPATSPRKRGLSWSQPVSYCGDVVCCGDVGHPVTQLVTKPRRIKSAKEEKPWCVYFW